MATHTGHADNTYKVILVILSILTIMAGMLMVCISMEWMSFPGDGYLCALVPVLVALLLLIIYLSIRKNKKIACDKKTKDKEKIDSSRRMFLTFSSSWVQTTAVDGMRHKMEAATSAVTKRRNPRSKHHLIPAGAADFETYKQKCSVCQACVEACPQKILKPSVKYENMMLPLISFDKGGCPIDCVRCTEVCPTGALKHITPEEKTAIQIGYAVWLRENCICIRENKECTACEKVCPNGSLQLIQSGRFRIPVINTGRCIGCGMCEAACPATPLKAIYVEGHEMHRES